MTGLGALLPKLLAQGLMPLGVVFELAVLAVLVRRRRPGLSRVLLVAAFAVLWTASTPRVAAALLAPLERQHLPVLEQDSPSADAIVVLGGAVASALPPRVSTELVDASDRVLHAARLYRAGKAPLVVASGGRTPGSRAAGSESGEIAALLVEWGVPREAILEEPRSTNTHENAAETAKLLRAKGAKRILLVTSAAHMPRALAVFRATGLAVIPSPTDFSAPGERAAVWLDYVPDPGALSTTSNAVKERLGMLYYRLRGWI